jgi:hypothetical protein
VSWRTDAAKRKPYIYLPVHLLILTNRKEQTDYTQIYPYST